MEMVSSGTGVETAVGAGVVSQGKIVMSPTYIWAIKSASTMELTDLEVDPEALQSLGLSIDDLYRINQEVNLECLDVLQIINPKAATSTRDRSVVSS